VRDSALWCSLPFLSLQSLAFLLATLWWTVVVASSFSGSFTRIWCLILRDLTPSHFVEARLAWKCDSATKGSLFDSKHHSWFLYPYWASILPFFDGPSSLLGVYLSRYLTFSPRLSRWRQVQSISVSFSVVNLWVICTAKPFAWI
jgi:hypothetical protein